jgi:hypothetical protein
MVLAPLDLDQRDAVHRQWCENHPSSPSIRAPAMAREAAR